MDLRKGPSGPEADIEPTGPAGGDLGGTYPNPSVTAITETSGPTSLTIGDVEDGALLIRDGNALRGITVEELGSLLCEEYDLDFAVSALASGTYEDVTVSTVGTVKDEAVMYTVNDATSDEPLQPGLTMAVYVDDDQCVFRFWKGGAGSTTAFDARGKLRRVKA